MARMRFTQDEEIVRDLARQYAEEKIDFITFFDTLTEFLTTLSEQRKEHPTTNV